MQIVLAGVHLEQFNAWSRSIISSASKLAQESQSPMDLHHLKTIIEACHSAREELDLFLAVIDYPVPAAVMDLMINASAQEFLYAT